MRAVLCGVAFMAAAYASISSLGAGGSITGRNPLRHCKWSGQHALITIREVPLRRTPFGDEIGFVHLARQFLVREVVGDDQRGSWLLLSDAVTGETAGWISGDTLMTLHNIIECRL